MEKAECMQIGFVMDDSANARKLLLMVTGFVHLGSRLLSASGARRIV